MRIEQEHLEWERVLRFDPRIEEGQPAQACAVPRSRMRATRDAERLATPGGAAEMARVRANPRARRRQLSALPRRRSSSPRRTATAARAAGQAASGPQDDKVEEAGDRKASMPVGRIS